MKYCMKCGQENEDDSGFCVNCGHPLEVSGVVNGNQQSRQTLNRFTDLGKDMVEKVTVNVQKTVNQISEKIEQEKVKKNEGNERQKQEQMAWKHQTEEARERSLQPNTSNGSAYMSQTELWTRLKTKSKRQQYFMEEDTDMIPALFMKRVNERMLENRVPARIQIKEISWDRLPKKEKIAYVEIIDRREINPFTHIIHFEKIGKFVFVEEKTFINPPNLPSYPRKKLPVKSGLSSWWLTMLIGMGVLILSLMIGSPSPVYGYSGLNIQGLAALFTILGIVFMCIGGYRGVQYRSILDNNRLAVEEERIWNEAWVNWRVTRFTHAFKDITNGRLSRIFDAVSACIKQVSDEEFKMAKLVLEEKSVMTENEAEEAIKNARVDDR